MNYIVRESNQIFIKNELIITNQNVLDGINYCNKALRELNRQTQKNNINIFQILGMRNLSGLVGEYFAKSIQINSSNSLQTNLHQDGYPDLLLTNNEKRLLYYTSLFNEKNGKKYPIDKISFSPFKYGGIEIKATCGSTPSSSKKSKPLIGEQRIELLNKFDWKAHHRETNNLLSILWDFIDEIPTIVACFYSNSLTPDDWGKIVQPKEGAGRTTSVSIMNSSGIKKMCSGWIAVIDSEKYIDALSKKKWIGRRVK